MTINNTTPISELKALGDCIENLIADIKYLDSLPHEEVRELYVKRYKIEQLVLSRIKELKITDSITLTEKQVDEVVKWMESWTKLKETAIPKRFRADFKPKEK